MICTRPTVNFFQYTTPKDDLIPVYTPCGDVVYLDPANYKDADALIRRAWEIGNASCDNEVK